MLGEPKDLIWINLITTPRRDGGKREDWNSGRSRLLAGVQPAAPDGEIMLGLSYFIKFYQLFIHESFFFPLKFHIFWVEKKPCSVATAMSHGSVQVELLHG